jgi:hypothetical protein
MSISFRAKRRKASSGVFCYVLYCLPLMALQLSYPAHISIHSIGKTTVMYEQLVLGVRAGLCSWDRRPWQSVHLHLAVMLAEANTRIMSSTCMYAHALYTIRVYARHNAMYRLHTRHTGVTCGVKCAQRNSSMQSYVVWTSSVVSYKYARRQNCTKHENPIHYRLPRTYTRPIELQQ